MPTILPPIKSTVPSSSLRAFVPSCETSSPSTTTIRVHPTATTTQVTAGAKFAEIPEETVPKVGIVRWIPEGDGTYRPRVQILETWVRVSLAHQYGVSIPRDTLVRLGNAGFIELCQPSPCHTAVNLDSLLRHIEACKDPEFWNPERMTRYRAALGSFKDT